MLEACHRRNVKKIFYSSSACMYPEHNQLDPDNPNWAEDSAYPANPDSEYGWEKLFSEQIYLAFHRNYDMEVRMARFYNIFGPEGTWQDGREKVPIHYLGLDQLIKNKEVVGRHKDLEDLKYLKKAQERRAAT